ncbi:MAG: hypothetical protein KDD51_02300 [Bdellovibrionales bacterium]|nr:hypothetical protein [Bdellovibrionales bacterium]
MKRTTFKGKLTDFNATSPELSGKAYGMEVTLEDGTKAYVVADKIYNEMGPNLTSPMHTGWLDWGNWIGRPMKGEYVSWKGMKIIVKLEDPNS